MKLIPKVLFVTFASMLIAHIVLLAQTRTRHVTLSAGRGIPSLITPDDELIILERDVSQSMITVAPHILARDQDLAQRALTADVIAVGEVTLARSELVNNDTWIETDVSIVVRELVKDSKPTALQSGARITFRHTGGEVSIDDVRIRADHYFLFKAGQKYLFFIRNIRRNNIVRVGLIGFPFRITEQGQLAPITMSTGNNTRAPSSLYGEDVAKVIAELKTRLDP